VLRLRPGAPTQAIALDEQVVRPHLGRALTGAHAFAFLPAAGAAEGVVRGQLMLSVADGAQVFALDLLASGDVFRLSLLPRLLPLGAMGGKGLVLAGADVWYDVGERWIAVAEQPRARYFREGWAQGDPLRFDGKLPQTVWHRVVIDACIPVGTEVRVLARAADQAEDLDGIAWAEAPALYRRGDGSELPFDRPFGDTSGDPQLGTFETLLQAAVGRWMELRLVLRGDGRASPRLRALRAWYPRFSYALEYLPAAYRADPSSARFLDRFLANPEGMFTAMEGRVARAEALLDPRVAPAEFLPWLAGWLGAALDESWDEARRRLFIRNAWLLFRWQGTPLGLLALIRLATDPCPDDSLFDPLRAGQGCAADGYGGSRLRLVEGFELRAAPGLLSATEDVVEGPAVLPLEARWTPSQGGAALNARWTTFLRDRYAAAGDVGDGPGLVRLATAWGLASPPAAFAALPFSPVLPTGAAEAADWRDFVDSALVASWARARASDADAWRVFLARRYGQIGALCDAWKLSGAARFQSFSSIGLPPEALLPADGAPLQDWAAFASLALPVQRNAHRFTVLVPTFPQEDPAARALRLAQVDAVVRRERPAHTDFEVKPFWALFRVGQARLGVDSVLGESGRFIAMVLDAGYLGEGWLAEGHPWTSERPVVGRDRLQR
jgi:phage tail-like protein